MENIGNNLIFKCKTRKMGFLYAPKHKHMTICSCFHSRSASYLPGLGKRLPLHNTSPTYCTCSMSKKHLDGYTVRSASAKALKTSQKHK